LADSVAEAANGAAMPNDKTKAINDARFNMVVLLFCTSCHGEICGAGTTLARANW
jgi:hypothetical protein